MLVEPQVHERLEHHHNPVLIISARQTGDDTLLVTIEGLRSDFEATDLSDLSRAYPALEDMAFNRVSGMSAGPEGEETCSVELIHRGDHPESVGFDYRGSRVILPAVGTPPKEVHPLMVWWAILYTLSMLARYHPESVDGPYRRRYVEVCRAHRVPPGSGSRLSSGRALAHLGRCWHSLIQ
jgi:hypothetical protein